MEAFWLDAYWFPGDFPHGVGNWVHRENDFPHGLKVLSEASHAGGMVFILWVEPERAGVNSQVALEHPEWILGNLSHSNLVNLGAPGALAYFTEVLLRLIDTYGVDVYRQDFNMDPGPAWLAHDEPGRRGITQIRHIEALYELFDTLHRERPQLLFDNCSSGGRRLDLKMVRRALVLWRSD